jgi:hypothetical protein
MEEAMFKRAWGSGSATGLILVGSLVAGCSSTSTPSASAASAASSHAAWSRLASECPVLQDPPYGLPANGKLIATTQVDTAKTYEVQCSYPSAAKLPLLELHVVIARGPDGYSQTVAEYDRQRTASGQLIGFDLADLADLDKVGDAAFAMYDQGTWKLMTRARSRNATVTVQISMSPKITETWSVTAPLQQQTPTLTTVTNELLAALQ